jgi:4a-hydroxytetrahydrobiopterin dehydratase
MNSSCDLTQKHCVPCRGGIPPLKGEALDRLLMQLEHGWTVIDEHHLEKTYNFKDFASAMDFANQVGAIAELEDHHPDLHVSYGKVRVEIWTHKVDGLTESDFILASKCDAAFR